MAYGMAYCRFRDGLGNKVQGAWAVVAAVGQNIVLKYWENQEEEKKKTLAIHTSSRDMKEERGVSTG
jgi:hypothetical protein